jgi:hypothetical protein
MAKTPKRRLITQLPAVLQTDTLKNFFAATVDQLFQPGESEAISGYVGQKPVYYNPDKDFYLAEPSPSRTAYQLEPAMISSNTGGVLTDSLCYDDLINYLRSQGAAVNNHSRMFEGDYYSWAPPVDLDKLNNYLQYVWMGSLTDDETANSIINLRAERAVYVYDGNAATTAYALPPADPVFVGEGEVPVVLVNGVPVANNVTTHGDAVISTSGLSVGDYIETIRYGDMTAVLDGLVTLDYSPFLAWQSVFPGLNDSNDYVNLPRTYEVGELTFAEDEHGSPMVWTCVTAHTASVRFLLDILKWEPAINAQMATSGSRVRLIDGIGTTVATGRPFILDGVGQAINLTPDYSGDTGGSTPQYVVIDRRSRDDSPWTRRNLWVHEASLDWTGQDFASRRATRPIIEFLPNIELFNYGTRRLADVQGVLSNSTVDVIDNWDLNPNDDNVWDTGKIALSRVNGQFFAHMPDGTIVGSVVVDDGYVLQPNDRLFVHQSNSTEPALNNLIYRVVSNPDTPLPSGATADVIELVLEGQPVRGDIIRVGHPTDSVFTDPVEYWFDGIEWQIAQTGASNPLFMLYDSSENALNDDNVYQGTDFAGSRLFGYKIGTGTPDAVLGFPIIVNSFAQPLFEIDPVVNRVTYVGGTVSGFYYHHFLSETDNGSFSNNWFPVATPSTQALVNGVYEIPLNLQANPGNLQVDTISRNEWFDHFSEIMTQQVGFTGHPYSVNNWRDTAKVLGNGNKILQHRSPLLKTMLISANANYDLPSSLRYAEQEYSRFRNKFVQTILDFRAAGTLVDTDAPELWVTAILNQLRLNKTSDFPFSGSTMAGGQFFIPPTPASMGLASVSQPVIYVDNSFSSPVTLVRGHDGSAVPAFGDMRDPIMLALEQRIFDNINARFKTEARPLFDLQHYVATKFVTATDLNYTSAEIDAMYSPYFQRWAQINRLDYRANNSYDPSNPFTWNFSSSVDRESNPVPGNWRGIYILYYDTFRPHVAPWEMLGFVDKPTWWQGEYGPAPYTSGNTKLWEDLRDGLIRGGPRAGTDVRYARADLDLVLPVDEEGNLLDPIQCGIIPDAPTYQQATAPWQAGDIGPVEALWRLSQSFCFAQAQIGFLIKPARFVEQGWDTTNLIQDDTGQWIYGPTGNRPLDSTIYVHGELDLTGTKVVAEGVQQWISDYMVSRGQAPSNFGSAIRGLTVKLAHKVAGFTTSDNLRVLADNFGLLPAEDVDVQLYHSPSTREEVYSGVVIEWTGQGWRVIGYDTRTPFFTTIPGLENGPKGLISLASTPEPVINTWRPNTYYPSGTNVAYQSTVYSAIKGHTSSAVFDQTFWSVVSAIPQQAPRVVTYGRGGPDTQQVAYGTVFATFQQVADFLLSYERYLVAHGWVFDQVNPDTQEPLDWSLAVREFLAWSQVNWQPGNFIALSPGASGLKFNTDHGMVLDVLSPINGVYGMLDRAGMPIKRENVVVNRIDGEAMLLSKNSDVFGSRVNIGEIEHVLIFNNTTIFNDIIYAPLFNLRQPRLRLIGNRAMDWNGRLDIPGYVLIDNVIKSNFDKAATDLLTMWDIEKADNATLRDHARHSIGYDSRDYLASLVLSEVEQFEFYQGLIHQKGAPGAFNKLLRSDFIEQSRDLQFFEEWAIKIDEYGAIQNRNRVAFLFGQSTVKRDPQYIEFRVTDANSPVVSQQPDWIELADSTITGVDSKWVERPNNPLSTFPQRPNAKPLPGDLPVSGYVRLTEVDHTVFSVDDVLTVYDANAGVTLPLGEVVWVHNNLESREISQVSATDWYELGIALGSGHWDGTSNARTLANDQTTVLDDGTRVFQSTAGEAPYISSDDSFVPVPGETYNVSFSVRKTLRETNGIKAFVRPAFDAFKADGSDAPALGTKSGFGFTKQTDMIDTSNWVLDRWYDVECEWTVPISPPFTEARSRLRVNRSYPDDLVTTPYSDAIFEVMSQEMVVSKRPVWDALKVYNLSADGNTNTVANVVTNAEDITLSNTTTRIYTVNPHGLVSTDRGLFIVIDGDTFSDPLLQGVQRVWDLGDNWIDILTTGKKGYEFVSKGQIGPALRVLRTIHFTNLDEFNSFKNRVGVLDGDIAYVDGSPWRVYQRGSITEILDDYADGEVQPDNQITIADDNNRRTDTFKFWNVVRSQPTRMDGARIASSLIYNLKTKVTTTSLEPEPLSLDHLTVVTPLTGIIPGRAKAEIDYIVDYDPANYNVVPSSFDEDGTPSFSSTGQAVGPWGPAQVGRVWWDLKTVRFLETETDNVSFGLTSSSRYNQEVQYRIGHWGQIAPSTSVDVYEWTRSTLHPLEYEAAVLTDTTGTIDGVVYNSENPSWVEAEESVGGVIATYFYFWVKNRLNIPANVGRQMSVATVSNFITNPMIEDQPWIAPVMPNGVLVGGVNPFLDDTFDESTESASSGTVLQIEVSDDDEGVVHDQWLLLRPQDERSLPPEWLWEKLRDSLVGFDQTKMLLPPVLVLPSAVTSVNKPPVWYTGPDADDVPIDPSLR